MHGFVDPRNAGCADALPGPRTTSESEDLAELHQICREGRLYEVEHWIKQGNPLQLAPETKIRRRKGASALVATLEAGNHSLVLLLLANGYDVNSETESPLDTALRVRRWDLVDLLLEWKADPSRVDPAVLFGTYQSKLFERFWGVGVDLTDGHALAEFLAEHPGAKPLLGFARRHRDDPRVQRELDVALVYHAGSGNEKGVQLCLWAGANPHTPACDLRYGGPCSHTAEREQGGEDDEDEEDGYEPLWSAIDVACRAGHVALLKRLKLDPELDDFDELYRWARDRYVIEYLMKIAPPRDPEGVLQHHFWRLGWWGDEWRAKDTLRALFEAGLRWTGASKEAAAGMRHTLRKLSDHAFTEVVSLLSKADYCDPELLREIGRTPAMRKRFKELGYLGFDEYNGRGSRRSRHRDPPMHAQRVRARFGIEPRKPKEPTHIPTPAYARIGSRTGGQELRLDRAALFDKVWSVPVATLASEWGISGPGLKKACARLGIPVPPRGYWARLRAGQRPRRPRLPAAPAGAPDTILVTTQTTD